MMPSESLSGSRTGEGREMLFQILQSEASKIFSQLQVARWEFQTFIANLRTTSVLKD